MKKNFHLSDIIKRLEQFNARILPRLGREVVNFSKERFVKKDWLGTESKPWPKRKNDTKKGSTLVASGRLKRSIRPLKTSADSITIGTDVPYAKIHNQGATIATTANVRAHTRKRNARPHSVKAHRRKVNINMPKRQFMPTSLSQSPQLEQRLKQIVETEINKIIKAMGGLY